MKKTVISVMGKDTVGITARVSAACAKYNVNIIDITQSVLQDMFVMVMLTDISGLNCNFKEFSEKIKAVFELKVASLSGYTPNVFGCGCCGSVDDLAYFDIENLNDIANLTALKSFAAANKIISETVTEETSSSPEMSYPMDSSHTTRETWLLLKANR